MDDTKNLIFGEGYGHNYLHSGQWNEPPVGTDNRKGIHNVVKP